MSEIIHVSVQQTHQALMQGVPTIHLFDIRDPQSFALAHPHAAIHLTNDNLAERLEACEFDDEIYVICYHGNSSQGVVQYLKTQGFENVFNVSGGFAAWQQQQLPIIGIQTGADQ